MTYKFDFSAWQNFDASSPAGLLENPSQTSGWTKRVAARCELSEQVESAAQLLARGELGESARQFRALLQIGLATHDTELTEVACHNLAAVLRQSQHWDAAEAWQQQSLSWRMRQAANSSQPSLDELGRLACDLTGCGCDAFLKGDWELAESFWRRALAIEEWRGCWEGQATDAGNLGLLAAARGHFPEGTRWLKESLRLHRLMLDESSVGTDLLNLAELSRLQNKFSRAIRLLREAVQSFHRAGAAPLRELAESRLREVQRIVSLQKIDPQLN